MGFQGSKQEVREFVVMFAYAGASGLFHLLRGHKIPMETEIYDCFTPRSFRF